MENKKLFELNDDALDAVSGGTPGAPSRFDVGNEIIMDLCPRCRTYGATGIIQQQIYRAGRLAIVEVRFNCCGKSAEVSTRSTLLYFP